MQDAKATAGVENGAPESGEKPVQLESDTKIESPKKKVKMTSVPVAELVYGDMLPADLQKAVVKEFEMVLQDRVMEETKDRKNAVEAYVYAMRNKFNGIYEEFVTSPEKEEFLSTLQEVEDWLYEDGEDETKGIYVAKLEELRKQGDPIEERYREYVERDALIDQLVYCINGYREAAMSSDPKFDHIDLPEKQKVINECVEAEVWLREKKQQQDGLPKYSTPVLLSADLLKKAKAVDRLCWPIMTKPKPAPLKPLTPEQQQLPPQAAQGGEAHSQAEANTKANAPNTNKATADVSNAYHQLLVSQWRRISRRLACKWEHLHKITPAKLPGITRLGSYIGALPIISLVGVGVLGL